MKKIGLLIAAIAMFAVLCGCGECKHEFNPATCEVPATCSKCGATDGEALGHKWIDANCVTAKTCSVCSAVEGSALGHDWADATCTEPQTCTRCSETQGDALGHKWTDATCVAPETCEVCGETQGEALGHSVETWAVVTAATCSEEGTESGTCTVCGETVERAIEKIEHTPSDWVVTVPAKKGTEGTRVKTCKVCDKEVAKEQFTLTPEEIEKEYKALCQYYNYQDLQRNPGEYKDKNITVSGTVFQVISEASSPLQYSLYFLRSNGNLYLVKIDNYGSGSRILEKDYITVWGTVGDLYTYETVRGSNNTVATVYVEYYK